MAGFEPASRVLETPALPLSYKDTFFPSHYENHFTKRLPEVQHFFKTFHVEFLRIFWNLLYYSDDRKIFIKNYLKVYQDVFIYFIYLLYLLYFIRVDQLQYI